MHYFVLISNFLSAELFIRGIQARTASYTSSIFSANTVLSKADAIWLLWIPAVRHHCGFCRIVSSRLQNSSSASYSKPFFPSTRTSSRQGSLRHRSGRPLASRRFRNCGDYCARNWQLCFFKFASGTNLPDRIVFCVTSFRLKNFLIYSCLSYIEK